MKKSLLSKANSILVEIIKKEWNNSWSNAISDIVQSSYQSQDICENNLLILKELSEDIFDFSKNSIVANQVNQLKDNFGREFASVYNVCNFVAKSYLENPSTIKSSLISACLQTLHSFLSWIPISYVLLTNLIESVLIPFLGTKKYLLVTLKCFEEVFGVELPSEPSEVASHCREQMFIAFNMLISKLSVHYSSSKDLELERKVIKKTKVLKDLTFFEMFCQNLSLCFLAFYKIHFDWLIDLSDESGHENEIYASLNEGLAYMANMVSVKESSTFKTALEFWLFVTSYLINHAPVLNGRVEYSKYDTVSKLVHSPSLSSAICQLVLRTPKPDEVLIYIDDDGIPKAETLKNTEASLLYETCKEIFVNFAGLNATKLKDILMFKLDLQIQHTEWSYNNISAFCYSCGCIADSLDFSSEREFYTTVVRALLFFVANKSDTQTKAVLAANIMHIVSKYRRFLIHNPEFLGTVVNKLFEFMTERYEGVKEMACNTFLEIAKQVNFVIVKMSDPNQKNDMFINYIISTTPMRISELEAFQKIQFYEAIGTILSACEDENAQKEMIFMLMSHLELPWISIGNRIDDVDFISSESVIADICFFIKINERVCASVGEAYSSYFDHALSNIDQIYKRYHWLIMNQLEHQGIKALMNLDMKRYRAVKKDILLLLKTFVSVAQNKTLFIEKYAYLLVMGLENYSNEIAEVREAEMLEFLATSISVLNTDVISVISEMIPHILNAVLPMITKDFSSYPEHRTGFFTLIQSMVQNCFEVFLRIPADLFKTIIDCVIWAIKHELCSIYEIGLETLNAILESVNQNLDFAEMFYKFYYQSILDDILFVLLDGLHSNGFSLQCETLFILINVLNVLRNPLFGSPDNKIATYNHIVGILTINFTNLAKTDHERLIRGIFEASMVNQKVFRGAVRDYMISLNLHTKENVN